jgi:hypothetical protein
LTRIEPKLGDLTGLDAAAAHPNAAMPSPLIFAQRFGGVVRILAVLTIIFASLCLIALKLGWLAEADWSENFVARLTIVFGMFLVCGSQLIGACLLLAVRPLEGVLSLFVPGYFMFALIRVGAYGSVTAVWGIGAVSIAIGTLLLA